MSPSHHAEIDAAIKAAIKRLNEALEDGRHELVQMYTDVVRELIRIIH